MKAQPAIAVLAFYLSSAFSSFAQVVGTVKLDGPAPARVEITGMDRVGCAAKDGQPRYDQTWVVGKNGELANVVVFIEPAHAPQAKEDAPHPVLKPAVITHKECLFIPHVLAIGVGQEVRVCNDDPFMHAFHTHSVENPVLNFGLLNKKERVVKFDSVEMFKVVCDLHPWEMAWICCLPSPFFAVSGDDGTFAINPPPPDGDYTFVAWHETGALLRQIVKVKDGKAVISFTIKSPVVVPPSRTSK